MSVDTQVVGRLPANAACAVVVACCRRLAARVTVSPWQCGRQVARLVDDNKQGPSRWLINCDTAALTSLETFDSNHHRTTSAPATGLYRLDTAVLIASVARTSSLQARSPARRARPTSLRPVPSRWSGRLEVCGLRFSRTRVHSADCTLIPQSMRMQKFTS